MKHLILGTAGHVDHGKTALVKALTGIDCDTHEEEKRRGITINLGFAHLDLPSGDSIGIIDVPGHRDFIHTMVSGASGIDIGLLVVAADSGIMPQTREHLSIMEVLGIKSGIIALTRSDLADDETVTSVEAELTTFTKGTFLENAPVVRVSVVTGKGIEQLKSVIARVAAQVEQRPMSEVFRMYIDRIFSVSGFGTVVTGSVLGGTVSSGTAVYLMPQGRELRVRRIERYGKEVRSAYAGDRASLNLTGLSREEFERGMLVSGRPLRTTTLLDVKLRLFDAGRPLDLWSQVFYLMGTFEAQVRVHLLDRSVAAPGSSALAQLHLPRPCAAQHGDRFVVRSTSSDLSLGGGTVIDATPLHHRRRSAAVVERLAQLAEGTHAGRIAAEVRKYSTGLTVASLAELLNLSEPEITADIKKLPDDIIVIEGGHNHLITKTFFTAHAQTIQAGLAKHHRLNPFVAEGKTVEEVIGLLGLPHNSGNENGIRQILEELSGKGVLRRVRHTWALASHSVSVPAGFEKSLVSIEEYLRSCGMKTPLFADLFQRVKEEKVDERMLKQICAYLVSGKKAYSIEGSYIHASIVDQCRQKLLEKLAGTPQGLTVAQFRDLVAGNRKICLLLFALFESEGVVERQGDVRILTDKGKNILHLRLRIDD